MKLEPNRCKNGAYCEKDKLMDKILSMIDCRMCKHYATSCGLELECINADKYEQILPVIQVWKTK